MSWAATLRAALAAALIGLSPLLVLSNTQPAQAYEPDEVLGDRALEMRARALSAELRCLVCQNQSIDDSNAPLARDLRVLIRERLTKGDTDAQVIDFLVAKYGEFVLLNPRFAPHTWVLWLTPLAVLLLGAAGVVIYQRRRGQTPRPAPLTRAERARLKKLLD